MCSVFSSGEEIDNLLDILDTTRTEVVHSEPTGHRPHLVKTCEGISLYVEGEEIVSGLDLTEAILLLAVGHCVFAQKYSPNRDLVIFIERSVFFVRQTVYLPRRVKQALEGVEGEGEKGKPTE